MMDKIRWWIFGWAIWDLGISFNGWRCEDDGDWVKGIRITGRHPTFPILLWELERKRHIVSSKQGE